MGGCMQSKRAARPDPEDGFSSGMVTNKGLSFWKMMKDRRFNTIRVAPAPLEDQCVTEVSGRTIVGVNRLQAPVAIRSPRRCSPRLDDEVPPQSLSMERLSPSMISEENADGDQLLELETATRPSTPDLSITGNPLFAKTINRKMELQAREDSSEIIRQLREAGIVVRPESRAGGVSYEYFVNEKFALLNKPPVRLQKLKKAKTAQDPKGDCQLREEIECRMEMAEKRRNDAIETVRQQQTKHIELDIHRAQETSAQLEEEKALAVAQRLQQKDIMSQVVQERQSIGRDIRTMQQKHHRTQVRLRGALKKMADKDEQLREAEARNVIEVAPIRDEEPNQNQDSHQNGGRFRRMFQNFQT
ncbi:uncharacterized protein LOC117296666 [Asterias rubens]|uniref:uncharacterized protein LOC117296666 n=1 Tax=Asterias rubens TaxID=7604 RepID=UPI001454F19C|nr:uncharacterized protein LOC117296666 [Asterias rubens]